MGLFLENGFANTTIPQIAAASGVSRTTFFRYYRSKRDILWAPFEAHLARLDEKLRSRPPEELLMTAVLRGIVDAFSHDVDATGVWLQRFRLQEEPDQRSDEAMYWQRWAAVITGFVRDRTGAAADDLTPEAIGGAIQGALLAFIRSLETERLHEPGAILGSFEERVRHVIDGLQRLATDIVDSAPTSAPAGP